MRQDRSESENKNMAAAYRCTCGATLSAEQIMDAISGFSVPMIDILGMRCPNCGTDIDVRVGSGNIELGYTYFAGDPHFEAQQSLRVPGLMVSEIPPHEIRVGLGDRNWSFLGPENVSRRFIIFADSIACGKTLPELGLSKLPIVIEAIERSEQKIPASPDEVLQEGDFLWLRGAYPDLLRAWTVLAQSSVKPK